MDYTNLIVALINAAPGLVTAMENWFINNPRLPNETDDQYAARIKQQALQMAQDTTDANNKVME